jgi:hypothetical protein
VTRSRSSAPGRTRPEGRAVAIVRLVSVLTLVFLVTACGDAKTSGATPTATLGGPSEITSSTPTTVPSDSLAPSDEPSPSDGASDGPSVSPSATPPDVTPSPDVSASPGPAAGCTGTDKNQAFYASVADAVAWTVYCPVLPAGWHVESGQYRLAGGGRMEIGYKGPGGTHFMLQEGAFCGDPAGCMPSGSEVGPTAFGDRDGTLVAVDDGSFAVVVDLTGTASWIATGTGIDEPTMRAFSAALITVGG